MLNKIRLKFTTKNQQTTHYTIDNRVTNMKNENNPQPPSILNPTSYTTPTTIAPPPNTTNNQHINRASETYQSTSLTSLGVTTNNSEEIQKNNNSGEALECDMIKGLNDIMWSLPVSLQQRTIKWTEAFLDKRDLIQLKRAKLRNLQSTNVPPKSAMFKFELGAS